MLVNYRGCVWILHASIHRCVTCIDGFTQGERDGSDDGDVVGWLDGLDGCEDGWREGSLVGVATGCPV